MPPSEVSRTAEAVGAALTEKLAATRLSHGSVEVHATPRRVVVVVPEVLPEEPDARRTVRGPRESVAFDAAGEPTKAALGFARGQGVDVGDLERLDQDGVTYVGITVTDAGRAAAEVLSGVLAELVAELRSEKNMRWNDPQLSFTRPVRWLLALLGDVVIPVSVSSLAAGRTTRVHRTASAPVVSVDSADGYLDLLARHGIVAAGARRRELIIAAAHELAASVNGTVDVVGEAALLDEITNLVEEPVAILGGFDERYLELPQEILTTVMRKHQRYLPVRTTDGELLPHFIAVANGSCDHHAVRAGNEAVLRARYEDASFFWRADLKVTPDAMKAGLEKLAFEERLGSMADRARRIGALAGSLGVAVGLSEKDRVTLERAAALAKFDLGSQMVIELTSLAGVMAREYALRAGEPAAVAQVLLDLERPRSATDSLPSSSVGALLALADRFDLLVSLFAVGAQPTGSSDPFGLRRAASGVVGILRAHPDLRAVTLEVGLAAAAEQVRAQGIAVSDGTLAEVAEFVVRRYEQQLLDADHDYQLVAAVLPLASAPASADESLAELERRAGDPELAALATALQRVRRIVPAGVPAGYQPATLTEPAELALHETLAKVPNEQRTLAEFIAAASTLTAPINTFFDEVLVMAEDQDLRAARLGLLATIRDLAAPVLDWQALGTSLD
jgi:glycyl-tRNA synthetase